MFGPIVGSSCARVEDARLLVGAGRFTDDVVVDGAAHCVFLRSPVARASIRGIDASKALAIPGVLAVLTGDDYVADGLGPIDHRPNPADAIDIRKRALLDVEGRDFPGRPHWPLALREADYIGEPIACVLAETLDVCNAALECIDIDFLELSPSISIGDALAADAGGATCFDVRIGDESLVREAIAKSAFVATHRFVLNRVANCQLEPRSAIGKFEDGRYTLICGNQGVSRIQMLVAEALNVAPAAVRVICPDVGGGFGPRTYLYAEQVCVLWAARRIGRPVRWTSTRNEAFLSDYQARDGVAEATIGLDARGAITAYDIDYVGNIGARTISYVTPANALRMFPTLYHVPLLGARVRGVVTNSVPTCPYRGAGRPEANHFMERMIDIVCAAHGLDRLATRRANLVSPAMLPYTSSAGLTYNYTDFPAYMEQAIHAADVAGFDARRADAASRGRLAGLGLANHIEGPVGAPVERVVLRARDGRIEAVVGTQSSGQGHETTFAQIVADLLDLPMDAIRIIQGDTDEVTNGGGTHSDRSLRYVSTLATAAARKLLSMATSAAAEMLQVKAEDVIYEAGVFQTPRSGARIGLFDVAMMQGKADGEASLATGATEDIFARLPAYPAGCAICEVEVDPQTGDIEITRYTTVDDVGFVVNPRIVEGQAHGGIAQGLGQAMREGVAYADAQLCTGSFMDYGIMRAADAPSFTVGNMETPISGNPYRIKGGGEGGIVPATAALINALCDAISQSAPDFAMPVRAQDVWRAAKAGTAR